MLILTRTLINRIYFNRIDSVNYIAKLEFQTVAVPIGLCLFKINCPLYYSIDVYEKVLFTEIFEIFINLLITVIKKSVPLVETLDYLDGILYRRFISIHNIRLKFSKLSLSETTKI